MLEIQDLGVDFAGRQVLTDVNLALSGGELVGLIGPNGAGKTTLLRAVLGLIPHTGRKTMQGRPGYVPQRHEFAWDYPVTVEQAVRAALTPRKPDRAAVAEALSQVDLTELRQRPVRVLSGGQRQRVLMARALVLRPRLLLLDEPFTGLDVPTQQLLTVLLGRLREQGHAILMTTHDLTAAAEVCTRVCLLNQTVVADGPPSVLDDPQHWLLAFGVRR